MNGILIPDKDVLPFAAHLERYQKYRPPDHLVVRESQREAVAVGYGKAFFVVRVIIYFTVGRMEGIV